MTAPPDQVVKLALETAAQSPCRSKRGVVVYAFSCGEPIIDGVGFNGPPRDAPCPGREVCAGTCGQRCVHAEVRAVRLAGWPRYGGSSELVHVELASTLLVQPMGPVSAGVTEQGHEWSQTAHVTIPGAIAACNGPSCPSCAALIADVGFVGGVWLFEVAPAGVPLPPRWRRYTAEEFYRTTLVRCEMKP